MLVRTEEIRGLPVMAVNHHVGYLGDLQVNDQRWVVEDIVVKTGHLLMSRLIFLPPVAIVRGEWSYRILCAALTQDQIVEAPGLETHPPVARQEGLREAHPPGHDFDSHLRSLWEIGH